MASVPGPESEVKHTPLPWGIITEFMPGSNRRVAGICTVLNHVDDMPSIVFEINDLEGNTDMSEADAAFIIRAVNVHDDLKEACKQLVNRLEDWRERHQKGWPPPLIDAALEFAHATLAAAKGELP